MTYAIVYSSKTGNTKRLAETIRAVLPAEAVCYCGTPDAAALAANILLLAFGPTKAAVTLRQRPFLKR